MKRVAGVVLSLLVAASAVAVLPPEAGATPEDAAVWEGQKGSPRSSMVRPSERIVGGWPASPADWPGVVLITFWDAAGRLFGACTGTLVAPRWVLTAAHCIPHSAQVSSVGVEDSRRFLSDAQYGYRHPSYVPLRRFDAGLLELFDPVSGLEHVTLGGPTDIAAVRSAGEAEVAGFGSTGDGRPGDSVLREAEVGILSDADCSFIWPTGFSPGSDICAGYVRVGACSGDSGGPLAMRDQRGLVQVGITSRGYDPCGSAPDVYTRVDAVRSWVESYVGPLDTPPPGEPSPPSPAPEDVVRIAGPDRIDTAIEASRTRFGGTGSADAVVLARWDDFPDALAGGVLAARLNAPLLLTRPAELDGRTRSEMERVLARDRTVYLLGGRAALSDDVSEAVQAAGYRVVRYGGPTRYETAVLVAEQGLGGGGPVFLATGTAFQAAIAAAPAAAAAGGVLLLTDGSSVPPATADYLVAQQQTPVYGVGEAAASGVPGMVGLAGADAYDTGRIVAEEFFPRADVVAIASGEVFADGLAGGALLGALRGPVLLTAPTALPASTRSYLRNHASTITEAFILGGSAAISNQVGEEIAASI